MDKAREVAKGNFLGVVTCPSQEHGELVDLAEAGWEEQMPDERYWSFTHARYPSIIVRYRPGTPPWVRVDRLLRA